jgi:dTDP-4-dehydrorhamnose 3,5-epimerase
MYQLTDLKKIPTSSGYVQKFIDRNHTQFSDFGEVYFSVLKNQEERPPKLHKEMIMNLTVILGEVEFIFFKTTNKKRQIIVSSENPQLLTVQPNVLFAFKNKSQSDAIICNFSNIVHDEQELVRK